MSVSAVAVTARDHYIGKGIAPIPASGITAVLYCESELNPGSQGAQSTETPGALNPSGAYGVASWNGPRQAALAAFAQQKGLNVADLTTQLDFVLTECANSYPPVWAAIQAPTTIQDFVTIFVEQYENPKDAPGEINRALPIATELLAIAPVTAAQPQATAAPAVVTPAAGAASPKSSKSPESLESPTIDPEIMAMDAAWIAISGFSAVAQKRMLAYLESRIGA